MLLLVVMFMSVTAVENTPLTSTEFNQSASDFVHFNQKYNKKHYRKFLETQDDDAFESVWNRSSIKKSTIVKDFRLDDVCVLMDPSTACKSCIEFEDHVSH